MIPSKSEHINELASALSKAQGEKNIFEESSIIKKIASLLEFKKNYRSNQNTKKSNLQKFFEKIAYGSSDCWYWIGGLTSGNYGNFRLLGENKAHRVSWLIHNGKIPQGLCVLHKCDVSSCVNPEHLFLGTQQENIDDMKKKGRMVCKGHKGDKHPGHKLTMEKIDWLKNEYKNGIKSYKQLAVELNLATMTVYRAINNISWKV